MKTFEYRIEYISPTGLGTREAELNELGKEGWEVFVIEPSPVEGGRVFYCKREKPSGKYDIPVDEYEYIQEAEKLDAEITVCALCGGINENHNANCPAHPDNTDASGIGYCPQCGWIVDDNHMSDCTFKEEDKDE